MEAYLHSIIAMLAVINPVVCGAMLLQIQKGKSKRNNIFASFFSMSIVLVILLMSALSGQYVLSAFGISMNLLIIIGGFVIVIFGFQIIIGQRGVPANNSSNGMLKLIFFAASPGSIAMAISLAADYQQDNLPLVALIGITIAIFISLAIIITMQLLVVQKKSSRAGFFSGFIGVIIIAMGLQFILDGFKHFFGI